MEKTTAGSMEFSNDEPLEATKQKKALIDSSSSLRFIDEVLEGDKDQAKANDATARFSAVPESIEIKEEEEQEREETHQRRRQSQFLLTQIQEEREKRRRSEFQFNYSRTVFPVREWQFSLPFGVEHPVLINPLVTAIAIVWLWGLVIWAAAEPSYALATLVEWRTWISLKFSWFYQGTTAVFFFYLMFILVRFGHIHLGLPRTENDAPEFSTASYMCMCFTSGIASGFFAVSVSQTVWNQREGHFYSLAGSHTQDELDLFALNLTVTQWGFAGWTKYVVVAVNMALAIHCFELPAALRSCLFPILRHYTWGWMGDCIDGLAIVASITGVAVSMGLGAVQIVSGLIFMGWVDGNASERQIASIQGAIIWVITVFFTASVLSGVHGSVKVLSKVALSFNVIFMVLVFVLDDSKFLLNLIVQETGYYLQYSMLELNFWTDAFGQLREGAGRAVDGKAADQGWMDAWAVFYAAWWVSWAPFVGVFVGTISKGRKLWEVIVYGLFIPVGYCLVFFTIMGGTGLRQSRQALELQQLGVTYFNDSAHFLSSSPICYDVPQENVEINNMTVFTNYLPGVTPVCLFDEESIDFSAYNIFNAFQFPSSFQGDGLGATLSLLFIVASTLHSIRSCDTASLVVDNLASTGRKHSHWLRRAFWAITLGSLASALLSTGGATALQAVQAASVLCGLPFTVILCFMMQSTFLMCRSAERSDRRGSEYKFPVQAEFEMPLYGGVFNAFEYIASLGKVNIARVRLGMHRPSQQHVVEFCKGLVVPFVSLYQILAAAYPTHLRSNLGLATCQMLCYFGWIGFMSASASHPQLVGPGWALFFISGGIICHVRSTLRSTFKIRSNGIADVLSACFVWPQVLTQLRIQRELMLDEKQNQSDEHGECARRADPGTLNAG